MTEVARAPFTIGQPVPPQNREQEFHCEVTDKYCKRRSMSASLNSSPFPTPSPTHSEIYQFRFLLQVVVYSNPTYNSKLTFIHTQNHAEQHRCSSLERASRKASLLKKNLDTEPQIDARRYAREPKCDELGVKLGLGTKPRLESRAEAS